MSRRPRKSRYAANPQRERHIKAVTGLDRMLSRAADPLFTGNVIVSVPVKGGRLGDPAFEIKRFGEPP